MNRKKSSIAAYMIGLAIIGIVSTILNSGLNFSSLAERFQIYGVKAALDYINLILGFLVLAGVFLFFVFRSAKEDKEYFWDFNTDDFREEE